MARIILIAALLASSATVAVAGIPRGMTLLADEQIADEATGITIARGNAEIASENRAIVGRADEIALNPAANEIVLKGRAMLTVGRKRYESDAVTCSLDFVRCTPLSGDQAPGTLTGGAAATMPE